MAWSVASRSSCWCSPPSPRCLLPGKSLTKCESLEKLLRFLVSAPSVFRAQILALQRPWESYTDKSHPYFCTGHAKCTIQFFSRYKYIRFQSVAALGGKNCSDLCRCNHENHT